MCRVLQVSESGYYKWRKLKETKLKEKEERIHKEEQLVTKAFHEHYGIYGSPRIYEVLKDWGTPMSERKIGRIMKRLGLKALQEKRFVTTTDSNHNEPIYPNLLQRKFSVEVPNAVWVSDITYIRTAEGWLYLASIMDLYSRKIISWELSSQMTKELALVPLKRALAIRSVQEGWIHHSDRGSQYCSLEYLELLRSHQAQISMSRKGDPYDNACIESFHATLKKELIYRYKLLTKAEAIERITDYIEHFYNAERKHSTLGYLSPNTYEKLAIH